MDRLHLSPVCGPVAAVLSGWLSACADEYDKRYALTFICLRV
jgi:hypothetical protein